MSAPLRVLDSGLRTAADNLALDAAMIASCRAGRYSGLLRFHRYEPTVSIGVHQPVTHAVRADYCASEGIEIARRATGGGSVYFDAHQLCWTLVFQRRLVDSTPSLAQWMQLLTQPLATALSGLGINAQYAPPNDIEINGRKIGSGFIDVGDSLVLFQGNLLLGVDTGRMLRALRAPTEKLSAAGIQSARDRLTTLSEHTDAVRLEAIKGEILYGYAQVLGHAFMSLPGPVPGTHHGVAAPAPRSGTDPMLDDDWRSLSGKTLQSFIKTKGGVLRALMRLDASGQRIQRLLIAGAVHVQPRDIFLALGDWMCGVMLDEWEEELNVFFHEHDMDTIDVTLNEIYRVIRAALARATQKDELDLNIDEANTLMVHGSDGASTNASGILAQATVMLVPYCAKPPSCKWRNRDGCPECGLCEVGDAYRLARERGMRVVSINNFEHLSSVLQDLRAQAVPAYVGMCCEHFYLKRQHAFRTAGIPAVLMDIAGANCYELQEEDQAYAGKFQAQSRLNLPVMEKVMRFVPRAELGAAQPDPPTQKWSKARPTDAHSPPCSDERMEGGPSDAKPAG